MQDQRLLKSYVQGAMNDMLEKWEDLIKDGDLKPNFSSRASP
jgi:hypothetical protein